MIKIACIGIAVQDRLYYVEKLPHGGGKYVAQDYKEIGGGPAATAAVAIARLGAQVDFIGRLGDDAAGKTLLSELESSGVNTSLTKVFSQARSSQSAVLVDQQGERIIINHPSPDLPYEPDWMKQIDFSQYDLVLADVRWHQGAEYAFTQARAADVPTLLDADITPQNILPLIQLADHAAFSEPGLIKATGENDVTKALTQADQMTPGTVYVTRGKSGCFWLQQQALQHQPGFNVKVVDTTGAGDVFHGALALAIAEKQPMAQAVRFANAVAALKCTQPGGRAGIPDRHQTDAFLSLCV
ncbi:sugar kinase [Budviciaceae bacterium BWR-B9]|uniref:Sulfofructose kinase n=1 Tax=Limnobaculum allomyrinae TaxID=2791986 RepID=A0ABS1IN39_9GAMM|nr:MULTISPECIES: sugar kinase [Limnobaculum]MBK5143165.1 sugar kinase [Limnobaculum allomyrinae]MBV7691053.1 sugar kinase [Limnobaculum sp. M2-1]